MVPLSGRQNRECENYVAQCLDTRKDERCISQKLLKYPYDGALDWDRTSVRAFGGPYSSTKLRERTRIIGVL